ncbi:hypothetical protein DFJ77DRAFT_52493 [Powellomyces hirtus]|nr:hypothetical protein DFJ77DRAFT_52493 [Powellomyces hirtus]
MKEASPQPSVASEASAPFSAPASIVEECEQPDPKPLSPAVQPLGSPVRVVRKESAGPRSAVTPVLESTPSAGSDQEALQPAVFVNDVDNADTSQDEPHVTVEDPFAESPTREHSSSDHEASESDDEYNPSPAEQRRRKSPTTVIAAKTWSFPALTTVETRRKTRSKQPARNARLPAPKKSPGDVLPAQKIDKKEGKRQPAKKIAKEKGTVHQHSKRNPITPTPALEESETEMVLDSEQPTRQTAKKPAKQVVAVHEHRMRDPVMPSPAMEISDTEMVLDSEPPKRKPIHQSLNVITPQNQMPTKTANEATIIESRKRPRKSEEDTCIMSVKKQRAIKLLRQVLAESSDESDLEETVVDHFVARRVPLATPATTPRNRPVTDPGYRGSEISEVFGELGRMYTKMLNDKAKHFEEKVSRSITRMNKDAEFVRESIAMSEARMNFHVTTMNAAADEFENSIERLMSNTGKMHNAIPPSREESQDGSSSSESECAGRNNQTDETHAASFAKDSDDSVGALVVRKRGDMETLKSFFFQERGKFLLRQANAFRNALS